VANNVDNPLERVPIYISRNYKNYQINTFTNVNHKINTQYDGTEGVQLEYTFKNIFFINEPIAAEMGVDTKTISDVDGYSSSSVAHSEHISNDAESVANVEANA